jgi:hypothetical protein
MDNKSFFKSWRLLLSAFIVLNVYGYSFAGNYFNKKIKNTFISSSLNKNFYNIEVQTLKFLDSQSSSVNGLVESFRGTSRFTFDIMTRAFCYGQGGVLDCQSFTYDSAIASLVYTLSGQTQKTERILDAYQKEFYKDKNDYIGLCNSYRTDKTDDQGLMMGIDGLKIHVGPAMWVAMSAIHYTAITDDLKYLGFVIDIAKWAQQVKHWQFKDGQKGGVAMGYGYEPPDWSQVYSTENNVDYYAVLCMLKELYFAGGKDTRLVFEQRNYWPEEIDDEMNNVERWMKQVAYNPKEKAFYCGYNEKGVQETPALDTVGWTIAAFGPKKLQQMGIDPFLLMDYAESHFLINSSIAGESVEGFDFTDKEGRANTRRMIWMEGTGIQTVAYQVMSRYAQSVGRYDKTEEYRMKAEKFSDQLEKAAQVIKLTNFALPYTSKRAAEKEVIFVYDGEWELPRGNKGQWVASVSSTVWRYFAMSGFNPLAFNTDRVKYKIVSAKSEIERFSAQKQ